MTFEELGILAKIAEHDDTVLTRRQTALYRVIDDLHAEINYIKVKITDAQRQLNDVEHLILANYYATHPEEKPHDFDTRVL